jgi:hypothetical protein
MKSNVSIYFPAIIVEAFSNLGCRMYGHQKGIWNGEQVWLWMPQRLLDISDSQLNYITARSEDGDRLYIAFSNQSKFRIKANFTVNPELSGLTKEYSVDVAPEGLKCLVLDNAALKVGFQKKMLTGLPGWSDDFVKDEYGRAMLLNVAATGKRVFAYASGDGKKWKSVTLSYRTDSGEWTEVQDSVFPYEFSIPVSEETSVFEYRMSLVDFDNIEHKGEVHILKK